MNRTNKKRISGLLAGAAACMLLVGSFAYFTDQHDTAADAQAGNINFTWVDAATNLSGAQEDTTWKTGFDADGVMNPGDSYDFSYTVGNTGSKSIDVKQTLVLVSDEPLTENAEEYTLTITGGNNATEVVPASIVTEGQGNAAKTTITYELADIILDGSVETETGSHGTTTDYTVKLNFDLGAKNKFMDSKVDLSYQAYAKQHRNAPDAGWAEVATYEAIAD